VPYLSASAVVIHYEEALYQMYGPLPLPFTFIYPFAKLFEKSLRSSKLGNCVGSLISPGCRHLIFRCVRLVGEEGCRCGISTVLEQVWYGSTKFSVRVPRNRCWTAHVRSGVVPTGTQVITMTSPFTALQVRLLHHFYAFTNKIVSCHKVTWYHHDVELHNVGFASSILTVWSDVSWTLKRRRSAPLYSDWQSWTFRPINICKNHRHIEGKKLHKISRIRQPLWIVVENFMENVRSFLKIAVFVEASFLCRNLYSVGQKFRLFIFLVTISNDVLCTLFFGLRISEGICNKTATELPTFADWVFLH